MSQPTLAEQRRSLQLRLRQGSCPDEGGKEEEVLAGAGGSSCGTATEVAKLLRRAVATEKAGSPEDLLSVLAQHIRLLAAAQPSQVLVSSIGLRVLKTVSLSCLSSSG